jgi:hypothetical protein
VCGIVRILPNVLADEPFCRDYPNVELRENPFGGARGDWDLNLLTKDLTRANGRQCAPDAPLRYKKQNGSKMA